MSSSYPTLLVRRVPDKTSTLASSVNQELTVPFLIWRLVLPVRQAPISRLQERLRA